MAVNLTCAQVSALLSYYIDDKLNDQLKHFVQSHLEVCPICRAKYDALKDMVASLKEIKQKLSDYSLERVPDDKARKDRLMYMNLSAYTDNELSDDENLRIKKNIISNPQARKQLEQINNLRKILHDSFEKTKNESKGDYAKFILRRIDIQEEVYGSDSFAKVVAIFIIVFTLCTIGAVWMYSI